MKHRPNEIDTIVGLRIRTRREEVGLTQAKVGEALGVSFQQVQKYENGQNRMSVGRLSTLCKVLMVPPTYFFVMDQEDFGHEIEIVRRNDRYSRRLLSAFNRVTDEFRRRKVVKVVEALIEAIDSPGETVQEALPDRPGDGRSADRDR